MAFLQALYGAITITTTFEKTALQVTRDEQLRQALQQYFAQNASSCPVATTRGLKMLHVPHRHWFKAP
eukprot:4690181-Amphidinium_carterae.1